MNLVNNFMDEDLYQIGVKVLVFVEENVLLLLSNKEVTGRLYWDIPGGRIKRGDSVYDTLKRELYEETGLCVSIEELDFIGCQLSQIRIPTAFGDTGLIFLVYRCSLSTIAQISLSNEHKEYKWVSKPDAAEIMNPRIPAEFILA